MYATFFVVEGSSRFPIDMLRYDTCFPADQAAVEEMAKAIPYTNERHRVELCLHHKDKKPRITYDRWRSFGWEVMSNVITNKT